MGERFYRGRGGKPRSRTESVRRSDIDDARAESRALGLEADIGMLHAERPRTRAECIDGPRPCPWVGCRHHLYLDVNPETGSIKFVHPDQEPWDLDRSCSLDVAEEGEHTLEELGGLLNLTRERARQIEFKALVRMGWSGTVRAASGE